MSIARTVSLKGSVINRFSHALSLTVAQSLSDIITD